MSCDAYTSRYLGSVHCGTSPTAPSPRGSTQPGLSRARWGGTSCRLRCFEKGRPGWGVVSSAIDTLDTAGLIELFPRDELPVDWRVVLAGTDVAGRPVVLAHADDGRLARMAIFDAVINNGDRKASHVLLNAEQAVRGIDHGIAFHPEPKLRTVLWGWADQPIDSDLLQEVTALRRQLDGALAGQLKRYLTEEELAALTNRVEGLLAAKTFPLPQPGWPPIPYPLW